MKENILYFLKKYKEYILVICIFALYLVMQYRLVGMYYDDFGNASLSYGYDSSDISGTNYSIRDLLDWSKYIYMHWGGRIIYALMLIPLLKTGAHVFMMIQVILILLTYVAMSVIVKKYSHNKYNKCYVLIVFIISYLILQGDILTMGFYWASASCLYVWPLLPLMCTIIVYLKNKSLIHDGHKVIFKNWGGLLLSIPLVTLSQEQLGGTMVVLFLFYLLLDIYKHKGKFLKIDACILGYSIFTFIFFLAAPGNWVRMDSNTEYATLSFIGKLQYSCPRVLSLMTNSGLRLFNLLLILVGFIIVTAIRKKHNRGYVVFSAFLIIPFAIVDIVDIYNITLVSENIRELCFTIFIFDMFFLLWNYFRDIDKVEFMAIMIAAVASVFCLVVSPSFAMRSCIPYVFMCMILIAVIMNNESNIIGKVCLLLLTVFGIFNAASVYKGYEQNYYMDNLNYNILSNYDGHSDKIYLLRYANNYYRAQMPCDSGYEYTDFWMKEYFDIPQSTQIMWRSMDEYLGYAKEVAFDIQYGDGFYGDEGGWHWAEKVSKFIIENNNDTECTVKLNFKIGTGYKEMSSVKLLCNDKVIAEINTNNDGITVEQITNLIPGENVFRLVTDAKQIDSGIDKRNLYMNVGEINCYPIDE